MQFMDKSPGSVLRELYYRELIECCTDKTRTSNKFDWERIAKELINVVNSTKRV